MTEHLALVEAGFSDEPRADIEGIDVSRLQKRLLELVDHTVLTWCDEAATAVADTEERAG